MHRRTVGLEEELLLVDPETRKGSASSQQVLKHAAEHTDRAESDILGHELFRHQLETRTPPALSLDELRTHVVHGRKLAAAAARAAGVATLAAGTLPMASGPPQVTRDDRYLDMIERYGEIARPGGTCGMHVHVQIDSDEQGVAVIDEIVPWLPVVLAVSANSPFYHGRDTRYASWRSQVWAQWPSAGPTQRFGSLERYREVSRALIAAGAARDEGMLYFDARLSKDNPTVEVRISDVCTDPEDGLLIAALVRALISRVADAGAFEAQHAWRTEMLRASQWRAARYGLSERLIDPTTSEPAPARDVLTRLVDLVRDQLEEYGDSELVHEGVARVLAHGGSARQRAAYEHSGGRLEAVVDDLVRRSEPGGS